MKIVKPPDEYNMEKYSLEQQKKKALEDCSYCPYCGENRSYSLFEYTFSKSVSGFRAKHSGISYTNSYWYGRKDKYSKFSLKKLIPQKFRKYTIRKFHCYSCGAEWESEPYIDNSSEGRYT